LRIFSSQSVEVNHIKHIFQFLLYLVPIFVLGQDIELFEQYNGHYDYLAFGNTLNEEENTGGSGNCTILTESSADFTLQPGQTLIAAYLYWAGVGEGDFEVELNGIPLIAERTFSTSLGGTILYFSAFVDVTTIVEANGNGTYTLSELDLTEIIPTYCTNTTNFGGWAINVIYEDPNLPLNQVNMFDGLENVSATNNEITITLDNLNVLDNTGAKIGFLAWEGDSSLAITETLQVNGNIISNPPLNPPDNAFNGTNSFTNSTELYNMDMDFYNIENNINPGDTTATITLTSGQDFVIVNNIITVLNTELPDATIEIDTVNGGTECGERDLELEYTVFNLNSTAVLPANTPIAFYANTTVIGQALTTIVIPIDGSESGTINLSIPANIPADFVLKAVVDDTGSGNGIVNETNEDNNEFSIDFHLLVFPVIVGLQNMEQCDVLGIERFDLTESTSQIDPVNTIAYHLSEDDALNEENPILTPEDFVNTSNPQTIWIRVSNPDCFLIDSFMIEVIPCPLPDATITIEDNIFACRMRDLSINYTVYNLEATGPLPAQTPIAFYVSGMLIGQSQTQNIIPIDGNEPGSIVVTLDESIPNIFTIRAVVDDLGIGIGVVFELNDFNNTFEIVVEFGVIPPIVPLPDLLKCDEGNDTAAFDLTVQNLLISNNSADTISYFLTLDDAIENSDPIENPFEFENTSDPQTIYVRQENEICFATASFLLTTENCLPFIPDGFSPSGDNVNDEFEITNLLDVYHNFELHIYSREGNLIFKGHNEDGFWSGIPNTGLLYKESLVPVGTYYYALFLNDSKYPNPFTGFVYVNY
jgi:gliding motility-associated-like protein